MFTEISSTIIRYWVEFALGLVVAGGTFFIKRFIELEKRDRAIAQKEFFENLTKGIQAETKVLVASVSDKYDTLDKEFEEVTNNVQTTVIENRNESKADDAKLQAQIVQLSDNMNSLRAGVLSIQGKEFKAECVKLLDDNHDITLDEWEDLDADHEAYNGLGGNHKGDYLYSLVKKKVENTLTTGK